MRAKLFQARAHRPGPPDRPRRHPKPIAEFLLRQESYYAEFFHAGNISLDLISFIF